jgi:hypothetical protein
MELESQVEELQEGGGMGIRQRLADLQGQLRIVQGEKERRVSQLEEREVSIAEYSMYISRNTSHYVFNFTFTHIYYLYCLLLYHVAVKNFVTCFLC